MKSKSRHSPEPVRLPVPTSALSWWPSQVRSSEPARQFRRQIQGGGRSVVCASRRHVSIPRQNRANQEQHMPTHPTGITAIVWLHLGCIVWLDKRFFPGATLATRQCNLRSSVYVRCPKMDGWSRGRKNNYLDSRYRWAARDHISFQEGGLLPLTHLPRRLPFAPLTL